MIDIHSHVLPFVDDGSPDLESSLRLIEEAVQIGVTDLFLTPHYMKVRNYLSDYRHNLAVFTRFSDAVKQAGFPIRLHLGNEIYYTITTVKDLKNQTVVPLGDSKNVLLEFSTGEEEEDIAEAIHNMSALGYRAIIAHVERYPYLNYNDYEVIKKMGALIQINASAIVGKYGAATQKNVFKMMKNNLVDFVASDIHVFRSNDLAEAYRLVVKKFDIATAERLFANATVLS